LLWLSPLLEHAARSTTANSPQIMSLNACFIDLSLSSCDLNDVFVD
jgi:hypothetical protein